MEKFLEGLQQQRDYVESIAANVERGSAYLGELKQYLPTLNQVITDLLAMAQSDTALIEISSDYILQVLNDILYGIEKEDPVYLEDVLRYGLIEIFDYVAMEVQRGGQNE